MRTKKQRDEKGRGRREERSKDPKNKNKKGLAEARKLNMSQSRQPL